MSASSSPDFDAQADAVLPLLANSQRDTDLGQFFITFARELTPTAPSPSTLVLRAHNFELAWELALTESVVAPIMAKASLQSTTWPTLFGLVKTAFANESLYVQGGFGSTIELKILLKLKEGVAVGLHFDLEQAATGVDTHEAMEKSHMVLHRAFHAADSRAQASQTALAKAKDDADALRVQLRASQTENSRLEARIAVGLAAAAAAASVDDGMGGGASAAAGGATGLPKKKKRPRNFLHPNRKPTRPRLG